MEDRRQCSEGSAIPEIFAKPAKIFAGDCENFAGLEKISQSQ